MPNLLSMLFGRFEKDYELNVNTKQQKSHGKRGKRKLRNRYAKKSYAKFGIKHFGTFSPVKPINGGR
jgi:hypothetical protein